MFWIYALIVMLCLLFYFGWLQGSATASRVGQAARQAAARAAKVMRRAAAKLGGREPAAVTAQRSRGTFDEPAQQALRAVEETQTRPTLDDLLTAGVVVGFNLLADTRLETDFEFVERQRQALGYFEEAMARLAADEQPEHWAPLFVIGRAGEWHGAVDTADAHETTLRRRVAEAAAQAETRLEAAQLVLAPEVVSDAQNVHDSSVSRDLAETLARLRALVGEPWPKARASQAISDYARAACPGDLPAIEIALRTIGPNRVSSLSASGDAPAATEDEVLGLVWARAEQSAEPHRTNLRDSCCAALADCVDERGMTVCTTGRATRLLGALAAVDADPTLGGAATLAMRRNEVFGRCSQMLARELARLGADDAADPDLAAAARAMADPGQPEPTAEAEAKLRELLTIQIDEIVEEQRPYVRDLDKLRRECMAAIDF